MVGKAGSLKYYGIRDELLEMVYEYITDYSYGNKTK